MRYRLLPAVVAIAAAGALAAAGARSELDPRGEIHIPIGIADTLKTFVEAEGIFMQSVHFRALQKMRCCSTRPLVGRSEPTSHPI
jgi:hypothetical protein